jgi:hypothetical protein
MSTPLPPDIVLTYNERSIIASYRAMDERGKYELLAKALRTAITRAARRPVTLRLVSGGVR